jgi:uncharacterized MAPEG superfamily protein
MKSIPSEAFWLAATTLMTAAFWMPYVINRLIEHGIFKALWDPYGDTSTKFGWADRMMRAHKNAVENLCVFAPLVMLVLITHRSSGATQLAAMSYFFIRLAHFVVFAAGVPVARVLLFLAGFVCQAVLAIAVLGGD